MRKTPVPITSEVINRMRVMRSEGKTNRDIAKELNVAIATVRRHIGNQPTGLCANYGSIVAHVTDVEGANAPASATLVKKSSLHLVAQTKVMEGKHYQFALDNFGNITIANLKPDDNRLRLNKAGMEELITELMDAYMELCQCSEGRG